MTPKFPTRRDSRLTRKDLTPELTRRYENFPKISKSFQDSYATATRRDDLDTTYTTAMQGASVIRV